MYFSDPLTIVLSNPGVSRLSEAQIARISPVGIGHANEAEAGVPYYDDTFDEDDECTTADISDPDGCAWGTCTPPKILAAWLLKKCL